MKINREELLKALSMAVKVVEKKSNMPILSAVYIDGPGQKVCATDLEMSMDYPLEITDFSSVTTETKVVGHANWLAYCDGVWQEEVETEYVDIFCLPAATCKSIVESLDKDTDTVEIVRSAQAENFMQTSMVRIGDHFRDLGMFPAEDFPAISFDSVQKEEDTGKTTISRESVLRLLPATSREEDGFTLRLINFDHEHGEAVATDGHRLHLTKAEVAGKTWGLPAFAAKTMASCVGKDADLSFTVGERNAVAKIGDAMFCIRTTDTRFPDYRAVVDTPKHTVTVKKSDAKPAMKQAAILTDKTYGGIKVSFNGQIDIEVINPDQGTYQKNEAIPCEGKVDPAVEVGMRLKYMADIIATAPKDDTEIEIGVTDETCPVHFQHEDFHGLVMPMRI